MSSLAQNPAPPIEAKGAQRKLRNFLLDARFQLKFASYVVALTLLVAGLLGAFLWRTTAVLFKETDDAVVARSRAAEKSHELSTATLNNELLEKFNDPAFEKQLKERSAAIDREFELEKAATIQARAQLHARQRMMMVALVSGLLAFVVFIGLASIVTSHRIVGPLHRVKKLAHEVADGKLKVPSHGLRPGDELKDVFEAFFEMVAGLRRREEEDLGRVRAALAVAQREKVSDDLIRELQTLEARLKAKLDP
jgi:methyl-accepting chemotaxis protein